MHLLLESLLRLFASLVSRGGEPLQETRNGRFGLTYPLRPGTFRLMSALELAAIAILVYQARHTPHSIHDLEAVFFAVILLPLPVILFSRTVRLDEEGLSVHSTLTGTRLIRWADMAYFERYRSPSAGKDTFFIRSAPQPGRTQTTITLPEMSYNTTHLLAEIRKRTPLPEQPRHKRHWWGG